MDMARAIDSAGTFGAVPAATLLREDMEASGPIRVSQVESEQKAILQVVRRLADSGEIVLTGGDDAYV